jgi:cytoskeletal protein CcmA (bactofilin family)
VNGSQPGVIIAEGTVTCNGASAGIVDIVAGDGDISVNGSCKVDGNVWSSGKATIDGGTGVGGNVIAAGVQASRPIGGSIWSSGDVKLTHGNTVGGTITARNLDSAGATIAKNVVANGNLTAVQTNFGAGINATGDVTLRDLTLNGKVVGKRLTLDGGVTVKGVSDIYGSATATAGWASSVQNITASEVNFTGGNKVNGTKTIRAASNVPAGAITQNPATPPRPGVPDWVDFDYDKSDWTGFTEIVLTGNCTVGMLRTELGKFTEPALVNALGCTNGIVIGGSDKVALNRDVAIFANRFNLDGSGWFTSTKDARLWLIEPDNVAAQNGQPTLPHCENRSFRLGGGFGFDAPIKTMIYTPCKMELSSSTVLTGHIYAGKVSIGGAGQLKYVRVGLPGVDLDTGSSSNPGGGQPPEPPAPIVTTVVTGTQLGTVLDYRDAPRS